MVLQLYSFANSTCGLRVAAVLNEKEVPFELHVVGMAELKTPEYLEKQPFGQVPYIVSCALIPSMLSFNWSQDDDGFILYESRAIARYIEARYPDKGTKLIPSAEDAKASALFEQAASVEISNFNPHASGAVHERWFKPCVQVSHPAFLLE